MCDKCRELDDRIEHYRRLAASPGRSGFDIRTFECRACDHIYQSVVALVDPLKSKGTAAWFQGELRAPT
jgi:hypothetical protein